MEICFSHTITPPGDGVSVIELMVTGVSRAVRETMTREELIQGSIAKWVYLERVVSELVNENPHQDVTIWDGGTTTCLLCMEYYADQCVDCPVMAQTKLTHCQKTPYSAAVRQNVAHIVLQRVRDELVFLQTILTIEALNGESGAIDRQ